VRAFCDLAHIMYRSVAPRERKRWADHIRILAGEHTVAEVVDAIPGLEVWDGDGEGLQSPYQERFARVLAEHFLERVPEPELPPVSDAIAAQLRALGGVT
jgi:hypothetical protein